MTLFKKLLVAVDFSDFSQEALRVAAGMARSFSPKILILHVCNTSKAVDPALMAAQGRALRSLLDLQKDVAKSAAQKLDNWVQHYDWADAEVECQVLTGTPYKVIADRAQEKRSNLIVMGSYGRSGFARMLIGSTTEKVLRKATCSVMAVTISVMEEEELSISEET